MRNFSISVVMRERDRPQKMWQPWYMEEADGGGKELPSRAQREQRTRERMNISRHPHLLLHPHAPNSPGCSSDEDEINVVDLTPPASHAAHAYTHGAYALPMEEEACEGPLDMSTKRRSPTPSTRPQNHAQNSPSPPPYHPRPYYLPRPSVITCVAPKYAQIRGNTPAPAHTHREPPPYSVATALLTHQRAHTHAQATAVSEARRRVMQAGPVDPEIDEHFRRSLGQDYHHLFAAPTPPSDPSSDSVDDHFAKALGETWTKLQAERKDPAPSSSSSSSSSSSTVAEGGGGEEGGPGRRDHGFPSSSSTTTSSSSSTSTSTSSSSSSSTVSPPRLIST